MYCMHLSCGTTLPCTDATECSSSVVDDVATVSCPDLDGQPDTGDLFCSIDSGTPEACEALH